MKNDVEICWEQEQANFNAAIGYYELEMLEEAEAALNKIHQFVALDAVPLLALRLNICYKRKHWRKMAAFATYLLLLDEFNPRWAFAHGWATAKLESEQT